MPARLPLSRLLPGPARRLLCLGLALGGLLAGAADATPSIVAIVPPEDHLAAGVPIFSADGSTVVSLSRFVDPTTSASESRAYLWTRDGGARDLAELGPDAPDPTRFIPRAISADGSR